MTVGRAFCDWLAATGRPTAHTAITRAILEQYLAAMHERVSAATVAKRYRSPRETMSPPTVPEQPVPPRPSTTSPSC